VRRTPARTLAAAGTAGAGVALAATAYLKVGGLPGMLYAGGLFLAAFFGAVAIVSGGSTAVREPQSPAAARRPRWGRNSRIIAELEAELAVTGAELDEHRRALANLATQLSHETETARLHAEQLEQKIRDLEYERDGLLELVAAERSGFEQTLEELGGGLGRHGSELAELERELEALIAR
jgi:chromosome segregation ATPase